jgi:hypothetical protein
LTESDGVESLITGGTALGVDSMSGVVEGAINLASVARVRAWAAFASCFFLISIRISSCLTFLAKSLISPGLNNMMFRQDQQDKMNRNTKLERSL